MRILVLLIVCLAWWTASAPAAPFVPADDSEVLERLPVRANDPVARELRRLRAEAARRPGDAAAAAALGFAYFEQGAAEGDPRYIGYAQAAVGHWWEQAAAPVDILVLRASILQWRHDFDGARADLDRAVARDPRNARAWALRAAIETVQARYADARAACRRLEGLVRPLIVAGCAALLDGLTGRAGPAYDALSRAYAGDAGASAAQRLWVLTRLAELGQRMGRADLAERHFRAALSLDVYDAFLTTAWADFLLDAGRHGEAADVVRELTRSDIMLLRLALAEQALGAPSLAEHVATLRARFEATRQRGDRLHLAEEARFALHFEGRPEEALRLALENWQSQREPQDARIVLEAALAARDPAGARPVLDWLSASGCEEPLVRGLAQRLSELRR